MGKRWVGRTGARPEKERRATLGLGLGRDDRSPVGEKDGNAAEVTGTRSEEETEGRADFRDAMFHTLPLLLLGTIAFAQNPIFSASKLVLVVFPGGVFG